MAPCTREELCSSLRKGHIFTYFTFFGQDPAAASGENEGIHFLSQAFPAPFEIDGVKYATAEHFMMAEKARLFGDDSIADQIIQTVDPMQAKALGRLVSNFDVEKWTTNRISIVTMGNHAKFTDPKNKKLKNLLLDTKESILVDATPTDTLWGTGLSRDCLDITSPEKWPGENLLGFVLMAVRERISQNN